MKNKLRRNLLLLLLLLAYSDIFSNDVETGFGYTNFPILGIPFNSRSASLANSSAALNFAGAGSSPASEALISRYTANVSFRQHMIDIMGGSFYFGAPIDKYGVLSFSMQYLSYGSFEGDLRDEYNNSIDGDIKPYAAIFSVGWSRVFKENYSAGVSIKYLHDKISDNLNSRIRQYTVKALAVDFGFQYHTDNERINYGILVKNLGGGIDKDDDIGDVDLPTLLSAGIEIKPSRISDTKILLELEKAVDAMIKFKLGLDLNVYNNQFFIRAGADAVNIGQRIATKIDVSNEDDYALTDWSIITAGIGIKSSDKIKRVINLDASIEIHANGLPPAANLSILFGI